MNLGNGKGSMSTASSWKSADLFPAGLRVLVVDDDPTCLLILDKMLRNCLYQVTKCNRAESALSLLRENKNGFDIVISDVHMPDMDGFKLLEHIGLEMDLPVIMMSADDGKNVVMKGVTHGACDYLIKPVRIEALKNIWQHVVRKRKNDWKDVEQSGSVEEHKPVEDADYSSSANEGSWRNSKRRKDEEDEADDRDDSSTLKKPRVVWSVELHQQFVAAVNQLGIDKAVPKKILELMNVPGLTRENVASHLQKYRLYLRRLSGVSQHPNGVSNSFLSPQEAASFGSMSSLNGIELQALAAAGHLPEQSLATLQAAGFGRSTPKSSIPMPLVDQRNLFSFENPKVRFGDGQQQHLSHSSKQMNLLHGIPTNMEPKQLANLQQSSQSFGMQVNTHGGQGSSLLMQMAQPHSRCQILNEATGSHVPRLPSSVGQPMLSNNGVAGGVLTRIGMGENGRGVRYSCVSQTSSILNYPVTQTQELPGSSFPLGSASNLASKGGPFPEEVDSDIKGFASSYDIFSDLQRHKSNEWDVGLTFDTNSLQGNLDVVSSSGLVHQGFSSRQRSGQSMNVGRAMFSAGEPTGIRNGQHHNNLLPDNSVRIKTETSSQLGQDELMSALLKQQQGGGVGASENEFDFDGYSVDNIPV